MMTEGDHLLSDFQLQKRLLGLQFQVFSFQTVHAVVCILGKWRFTTTICKLRVSPFVGTDICETVSNFEVAVVNFVFFLRTKAIFNFLFDNS